MNDVDREKLVDYFLGQLSADDALEVESCIASHAHWREAHEKLARTFNPLAGYRDACQSAPLGLALSTCRMIREKAQVVQAAAPVAARGAIASEPVARDSAPRAKTTAPGRSGNRHCAPGRRPLVQMTPAVDVSVGRSRFRWTDLTVAIAVAIIASVAILPAILSSRVDARVQFCADNLRELGTSMTKYSDSHAGMFPAIPTQGRLAAASCYAPLLKADGFLPDVSRLICRESPMAEKLLDKGVEVPTLEALRAMPEEEFAHTVEEMGGCYGYNLGYVDEDKVRPTQNLGRSQFALMSDRPSTDGANSVSLNHGGFGQNVLFEDGRVKYVKTCKPAGEDDIFRNDKGLVSAGLHVNDSVIGGGAQSPVVP